MAKTITQWRARVGFRGVEGAGVM